MADTTDTITPAAVKRDTPAPAQTADAPRRVSARAGANGKPTDPESMRLEIERTRARIADTLDELEGRLVRERQALELRKQELWRTVTLKGAREKLSKEPWRSVAIAFAAGYIIAAIRD